jgi:ribosomal protein S18 acetylase RimI-like enzyme
MGKSSHKPKEQFLCEPAQPADIPELVDLCLLVERQHEKYWSLRWELRPDIRERYINWMTSNLAKPDWLYLVARSRPAKNKPAVIAGALVAALTQEIPIYAFTHYVFIHDMAVKPEFRRRGIARKLLLEARNWAAGKGVNQLRLMAAEANTPAQKLFEKFGFRTTYREMVLPI